MVYIEYTPWDGTHEDRVWYNPITDIARPYHPPLLTQWICDKKYIKNDDGTDLIDPLSNKRQKIYQRHRVRISVLPKKSRMFIVPCVGCNGDAMATTFCKTCTEVFCDECFESMHSRGNRRNHEFHPIPQCAECLKWHRPKPYHKKQAATIQIQGGNFDGYEVCDECWFSIVSKTAVGCTLHRLLAVCFTCNNYTATWECLECNDELYCNDCYLEAHHSGKRQLHRSTPLNYYPKSLFRNDRHENERKNYKK